MAQLEFTQALALLTESARAMSTGSQPLDGLLFGSMTRVQYPDISDSLGAPLKVMRWVREQRTSEWAVLTQISSPMIDFANLQLIEGYLDSLVQTASAKGAQLKVLDLEGFYVAVIAGLTRPSSTIDDLCTQETRLQEFLSELRTESPIGKGIYYRF